MRLPGAWHQARIHRHRLGGCQTVPFCFNSSNRQTTKTRSKKERTSPNCSRFTITSLRKVPEDEGRSSRESRCASAHPDLLFCSCCSFGPSAAGHHLVAHRHGKKRAVSPLWHLVRRTGPDLYHQRGLHSVGGTHISVHTHLPSQTGFHVAASTCCQQRVSEQRERDELPGSRQTPEERVSFSKAWALSGAKKPLYSLPCGAWGDLLMPERTTSKLKP